MKIAVEAQSLILTSLSTLARLNAGLAPTYNNTVNRWWIWIAFSHNPMNSSSQPHRWRLDQNRMIKKILVLKFGPSDLDLTITNVTDYMTAHNPNIAYIFATGMAVIAFTNCCKYLQNFHITARILKKTQCF